MTTIFVLEEHSNYDRTDVLGVFTTKAKAVEFHIACCRRNLAYAKQAAADNTDPAYDLTDWIAKQQKRLDVAEAWDGENPISESLGSIYIYEVELDPELP